ncbi:MAG: 2-C-methyl-D-erythritol 2,4-cyclodiphosphate synthase [Gammaproteobacteria bacterium]|nr:2-C-methyl-D-erythritol 2,4-cyclodiphosphate synthase [Gammaproteobacteria bacterium]
MTAALRIGHGFDVHAFEAGDHVMLCGVRIPHTQGVRAHSDGDVALHALCDALLGAAGLGDIGEHFPDDDAQYAGSSSRALLCEVVAQLGERGCRVSNVDITIIAQAPRLAEYRAAMRENVACDLRVDTHRVNVKATTTEHLGFAGRKEGMAAFAVALLLQEP